MRKNGFTLSELLIALVVLGVIATFTIPKVLSSQQDSKFNAVAKETIAAFSGAYEEYKRQNTVGPTTSPVHLTPYLNYVRVYTNTVDESPGAGSLDCTGLWRCVTLHNGAVVLVHTWPIGSLGGDARAMEFLIDPDGTFTGKEDSLWMNLYVTGRVTSWETATPYYKNNLGPLSGGGPDPDWFSWD